MDKKQRIDYLVEELNRASAAYYNDRDEIMSNYEWDELFDELTKLEKETGYVREDSPTVKAGYEENISSKKEAHEYPALSLAKSKDIGVIQAWAGNRDIWVSWKLDGLTLVATYDDGQLTKLLTRGNGSVGTNITYLADCINGLPGKTDYPGHLVVIGEAVIAYKDFEALNTEIENDDEKYSNPRNLVSGTMALDYTRKEEVRNRRVAFKAFTLVHTDEEIVSWGERMALLDKLGFNTVERTRTTPEKLENAIDEFTKKVEGYKYPVDGLVVTFDDTLYASSGSVTGHHATNAGMAYKWADVSAETHLDHIEWQCAASTISPVAVFDPVQLEGTIVKRASLCNISEMKRLGIGADRVTELTVIKSNMIIPKCIAANGHGTAFEIPDRCPVCGSKTEIKVGKVTGTETLHCTNEECSAKHIKKYTRFVSKEGMDIDGLSVETIVKFINKGFITDFADIFDIARYKDEITAMEGFGEKSYNNLIASLEKRRNVTPTAFIYSLSIPLIGSDAAKRIISKLGTEGFFDRLKNGENFEDIDGLGPEKSDSLMKWYGKEANRELTEKLLQKVSVENVEPAKESDGKCKGLTFVVTGDVYIFKNRNELKAYVEAQGGKVTGSVSAKTDYLINNDTTSTSSKNQKAKQLNIPIIAEEEFVELFGGGSQ